MPQRAPCLDVHPNVGYQNTRGNCNICLTGLTVRNARQFNALLQQDGFQSELHLLSGVRHELTDEALELALRLFEQVGKK